MGRRGAQQVPPEGPSRLEARGPQGPCGQQRGRRTVWEIGELEISDLNQQNGLLPTNDT